MMAVVCNRELWTEQNMFFRQCGNPCSATESILMRGSTAWLNGATPNILIDHRKTQATIR